MALHQWSCVEHPKQNSVIKRNHQHLLNMAHALFFQSHVPIKFQGECILIATYLINRTPSPLLHQETPYQLLYGQQVDYRHLGVFGDLCYASTLPSYRTKFDPRAVTCIFVGYLLSSKDIDYMILNQKPSSLSRDVTFHGPYFPSNQYLISLMLQIHFQTQSYPSPNLI